MSPSQIASPASPDPAERPLTGFTVLDFSTMMAGPYCTRVLADLGARVIKVESAHGDHIRGRPPLRDGLSTYFGQLNAGKESIALDLKNPRARDVAAALAERCDVVMENFRPGVMKRLGLDYDTLSARNPGLVYCAISGFGQTGPGALRPAYAPIVHAASGYDLAHMKYQDGAAKPANTGIFMADVMAGIHAISGIQAALLARARTGRGQMVDVSLIESMFNLMVFEVQEAQFPSEHRRPVYEPLRSADGFVIVAPISQRNFESLAHTIGHPEWLVDPRFSNARAREQNWAELSREIERWTSQRSGLDCEHTLMDAGVPCSRYLSTAEAMRDPQVAERGSFSTIHDAAGDYRVANPPFKFSAMPCEARPFVPALGGDGDKILGEVLGMSTEAIEALRECGALAGAAQGH
ncbi:MAG: CoA transferase [Burkholderiaceae bacterium]|nr:CoA transferase [Burkholderiaceae bacterium]